MIQSLLEVQARIVDLEQQLADMKEHRNRLVVPLCRNDFPEEVVVNIIAYLQASLCSRKEANLLRWSRVLRLCRRIRSIALRAPELWRTVQYFPSNLRTTNDVALSRRWIQLSHDRAGIGLVSLTIVYDDDLVSRDSCPRHTTDGAKELQCSDIGPVIQRTRSVRFRALGYTPGLNNSEFPWPLAYISWPVLEEAHVYGSSVTLGHRLLAKASNTLTSLRLLGCWKLQSFPSLPQLKHFSVEKLLLKGHFDEVHRFFQNTCMLTTIEMGLTPFASAHNGEHLPKARGLTVVALPHLESLRICDGYLELTDWLLDMFPDPTHHLAIMVRRYSSDPEADDEVFARVLGRIAPYILRRDATIGTGDAMTLHSHAYQLHVSGVKVAPVAALGTLPRAAGNARPMSLTFKLCPVSPILQTLPHAVCESMCTDEVLPQLLRVCDAVSFKFMEDFVKLVPIFLKYAEAPISRLTIIEPVNMRGTSTSRNTNALERFMRTRKEAGSPLLRLAMNPKEWDDTENIKDKWMDEGLIAEFIPIYA